MPRGDQTGPMGMGPMTGRAAGYCAGSGAPGYAHGAFGRGYGRGVGWSGGFGGGRGRRNWFHATGLPGWMRFGAHAAPYPKLDPEAEKQALRAQEEALQSDLDFIRKRLAEFEGDTAKAR